MRQLIALKRLWDLAMCFTTPLIGGTRYVLEQENLPSMPQGGSPDVSYVCACTVTLETVKTLNMDDETIGLASRRVDRYNYDEVFQYPPTIEKVLLKKLLIVRGIK